MSSGGALNNLDLQIGLIEDNYEDVLEQIDDNINKKRRKFLIAKVVSIIVLSLFILGETIFVFFYVSRDSSSDALLIFCLELAINLTLSLLCIIQITIAFVSLLRTLREENLAHVKKSYLLLHSITPALVMICQSVLILFISIWLA